MLNRYGSKRRYLKGKGKRKPRTLMFKLLVLAHPLTNLRRLELRRWMRKQILSLKCLDRRQILRLVKEFKRKKVNRRLRRMIVSHRLIRNARKFNRNQLMIGRLVKAYRRSMTLRVRKFTNRRVWNRKFRKWKQILQRYRPNRLNRVFCLMGLLARGKLVRAFTFFL